MAKKGTASTGFSKANPPTQADVTKALRALNNVLEYAQPEVLANAIAAHQAPDFQQEVFTALARSLKLEDIAQGALVATSRATKDELKNSEVAPEKYAVSNAGSTGKPYWEERGFGDSSTYYSQIGR